MSALPTLRSQPLFLGARMLGFAAAAALAILGAHWLPGTQWALWLAGVAILVAIWHGSFDGALAEEVLRPRLGTSWRAPFYVSYLLAGAAIFFLWWIAPRIALMAFLLYSALHFGTESEPKLSPIHVLTGVASGFVPIAAACHWQPHQVAAIFALMLRGSAGFAALLTALSGRLLWPVVAVTVLGGLRLRGIERWISWSLVATELILFRSCSPVAAFALFFCLWHTPEHLLSTSTDRKGSFLPSLLLHHLRQGFPFWLISVAGLGIIYWLGRHEVYPYLGAIFIALSALTAPHMALAELCRNHPFKHSEAVHCNDALTETALP